MKEAVRIVVAAAIPALLVSLAYQMLVPVDGDASTIDGISFPATVRLSGTTLKLCGGGTRLKFNVVKVYAAGLYADAGSLAPFAGKPVSELSKSASFYESLVTGKFAKTLLLQFHRSVGADTSESA